MQRIKLSQATPGMVLAQAVEIDGVTLCGKDSTLTAKLIARLARREVQSVVIEGDEQLSEADLSARAAQEKQNLDRRFRRLAKDPFMMELKDVFARRLAGGPADAEPNDPES